MASKWRQAAAPVIARVIAEVGTGDMRALRNALREAYPFGPYEYHPLKIWCDEINAQLGKKKPAPKVSDPNQPAFTFEARDGNEVS